MDRQIYRAIDHAIEHIKNKDYELAINLLTQAIKDDKVKSRKEDSCPYQENM